MPAFLLIAAGSNICSLEFLYETNPPSLTIEGGDLPRIACIRQMNGHMRTLAAVIGLFAANLPLLRPRGTRDYVLITEADPVANFLYKNRDA